MQAQHDKQRVVKCTSCGALNRTPDYSLRQRALCGGCKTPLPEVFYKSAIRFLCNPRPFLKKHYAWVVLLVIVGLAVLKLNHEGSSSSSSSYTPSEPSPPSYPAASRPVTPAFTEPELPLPANGQVVRYSSGEAEAPFEIKSDYGSHYLVKLVNAYSKAAVLTVFVRGGSTVNIDVPVGNYEVRYAAGNRWYGDVYLFGPETAYAKADRNFDFRYEGNQVSGYTITLYKVQGGNLKTSRIKPNEF